MRVLVTRPLDQAARTADRLLASGHEPVLAPVLEIVPTGAVPPDEPFDLILATSAQVFGAWKASPALRSAPLACVGEKTAEAAQAAGFFVKCAEPRAETLAERLIGECCPKSALYLAGRERKPALETLLRVAGWRVTVVEAYEARPVANLSPQIRAALDRGEVDAILHYSPRSAKLALALIGAEAAARLRHFCLSQDIADVCQTAAPAKQILTASQPDEDSLMTLLDPAEPPAGNDCA